MSESKASSKKLNNLDKLVLPSSVVGTAAEVKRSISSPVISTDPRSPRYNLLSPPLAAPPSTPTTSSPVSPSDQHQPHHQILRAFVSRVFQVTSSKSEPAILPRPRRSDSSSKRIHRSTNCYHSIGVKKSNTSDVDLESAKKDFMQLKLNDHDFMGNGDHSSIWNNDDEPKKQQKKNDSTSTIIDPERKSVLVNKALTSFMYGALKKQSSHLQLAQMRVKMKTEECAARLILHSLLLNSYRQAKTALEKVKNENLHHAKTVENLCLQLRVVRHLQTNEKEKIVERSHEIGVLKDEITIQKKEMDATKKKLVEVEEQLSNSHEDSNKLMKEKLQIQSELACLQEEIDIVNGSLGLEKKQVKKYEETEKQLKRQIGEAKHEIKELICQSTQWQEHARSFETENWQLKIRVREGESQLNKLKMNYHKIFEANEVLVSDKAKLSKHKAQIDKKLQDITQESFTNQRNIAVTKMELQQQKEKTAVLEQTLDQLEAENELIKKELYDYKLSNLHRRRAWVHFIAKIIHPIDTIRFYIFGQIEPDQLYDGSSGSEGEAEDLVPSQIVTKSFGYYQ